MSRKGKTTHCLIVHVESELGGDSSVEGPVHGGVYGGIGEKNLVLNYKLG